MKHAEELHFAGNVSVLLTNGDILQGTFLGFVEERKAEAPCFFLPPAGKNDNNEGVNDGQFILIRLTCAFSVFPVGSKVAVNVAQILVIGPGLSGCAPAPAD